jgi:hypothetical protein
MAHHLNVNEDTQKHAFFSVKEKAWQGWARSWTSTKL